MQVWDPNCFICYIFGFAPVFGHGRVMVKRNIHCALLVIFPWNGVPGNQHFILRILIIALEQGNRLISIALLPLVINDDFKIVTLIMCQLEHIFDAHWNISTTVGWITANFGTTFMIRARWFYRLWWSLCFSSSHHSLTSLVHYNIWKWCTAISASSIVKLVWTNR